MAELSKFERAILGEMPLLAASEFYLGLKQASVEDPAMSGEFTLPVPEVLQMMGAMVENELKTMLAYKVYAQSLRGPMHFAISKEFEDHAEEELEHVDFLLRRMSVLGGAIHLPDVQSPAAATDINAILSTMVEIEEVGAEKWKALHAVCTDGSATKFKIEEFMTREQHHLDELKQMMTSEAPPIDAAPITPGAAPAPAAPAEPAAPEKKAMAAALDKLAKEDENLLHQFGGWLGKNPIIAQAGLSSMSGAAMGAHMGGARGALIGAVAGAVAGAAGTEVRRGMIETPGSKPHLMDSRLPNAFGDTSKLLEHSMTFGKTQDFFKKKAEEDAEVPQKPGHSKTRQALEVGGAIAGMTGFGALSSKQHEKKLRMAKALKKIGALDPQSWLANEQMAQQAQEGNEVDYFREQMETAQSQASQSDQSSQQAQQQVQTLTQQLAEMQASQQGAMQTAMQASSATQQAAMQNVQQAYAAASQAQLQALEEQKKTIEHQQMAVNMRQALQGLRQTVMQAAAQDPTPDFEAQMAAVGAPPAQPPIDPATGAPAVDPATGQPLSAGPSAGAAPPADPAAAQQTQPGQPAAAPDPGQGGAPPPDGASGSAPPAGEPPAAGGKPSTTVSIKQGSMGQMAGTLAGAGAGYLAGHSQPLTERMQGAISGMEEGGPGGFAKAMMIAQMKNAVGALESAQKSPRASTLAGAAIGGGAVPAAKMIGRSVGDMSRAIGQTREALA